MAGAHIVVTQKGLDMLERKFKKTEKSVDKLGKKGTKVSRLMSRNLGSMKGAFRGLGAAIGGIGVGIAVKKVLDFDAVLGQLQADLKMNNTEALGLKNTMLDLTVAYGTTKEQVAAAIQTFQDEGDIVRETLPTLGKLTQMHKATGAEAMHLAKVQSVLIKVLGFTPDKAINQMTKLFDQTERGSIALRKMAAVLPRVLAGAATYGFTGQRAITQVGSLLQVAGQAAGGAPELAATGATAMMRDLVAKATLLKKYKINVLDKEGNLKDIDVIMKAIIKLTKGTLALTEKGKRVPLFGDESLKTAGVYKTSLDPTTGKYKKKSVVSKVSDAKASFDIVINAYNRKITGVSVNYEKLQRTSAELDAALQNYGTTVLGFISQNQALSATIAGVGYALIKLTPGLIKMSQGLGTGAVTGAIGKAAGLAGVASLAYAAGSYFDELTNTSGTLADLAMKIKRSGSKRKEAAYSKETARVGALEQAKQLVSLSKRGLKTVSTAGGGKMDLTQENVIKKILDSAASKGMSKDVIQSLIPALQDLTKELRKNPPKTIIQPKGGVEKLETKRGTPK